MKRGLLISLICAMSSACGGVVSSLPAEEIVYHFDASVAVSPEKPVEGLRVTLALEVTSGCNEDVLADVFIKVVSDDGTEELYEQSWPEVPFAPADVWSLNQGFDPTALKSSSYKVQLQVRRHDNGQVLYDQPELSTLKFAAE